MCPVLSRLHFKKIRYGPRKCDMRYANTLWAARTRYVICEYATGRAIREYAMGRENKICDTRIRAPRAIAKWLSRPPQFWVHSVCITSNSWSMRIRETDGECLVTVSIQVYLPSCPLLAGQELQQYCWFPTQWQSQPHRPSPVGQVGHFHQIQWLKPTQRIPNTQKQLVLQATSNACIHVQLQHGLIPM